MLAITGVREDGFHELVSVVAPLEFGDDLTIEVRSGLTSDNLTCDAPDVPTDARNLVLQAAQVFREKVPTAPFFAFELDKRIPAGAGLGGGSSNASIALRGMNELCGQPLDEAALYDLAARLGSDCPLFLAGQPMIMRGRGEHLSPLPPAARAALQGQELALFRPPFGIGTGWAYGVMKAHAPTMYCPARVAEAMLEHWFASPADLASWPLFNNMEAAAATKYLAIPSLLEDLQRTHQIRCRMSGSGSACFALIESPLKGEQLQQLVQDAWGADCWWQSTRIASA